MSISQRLGTLVAVICGLLLAFTALLLASQWRIYQAADRALASFESFRATLIVMENASAERGPTNGALGEDAPTPEARMTALNRARRETDTSLARFYALIQEQDECDSCASQREAARQAEADLAAARKNIDHLLELPLAKRSPQALGDAVNRMVAVIPKIVPIADISGADIVRVDGEVLGPLQMARLASMLREQAGLLGSRYTSALAGRRSLQMAEQYSVELSLGRIDQLYALIESRAQDSPAIEQAFQRMNEQYFGTGMTYAADVRRQLETPQGSPLPTTQQFADRYVPLMRPIVDFRNQMLDLVRAELHDWRNAVLTRSVLAAAAALALISLLILMLWLFRQRVIVPLTEATGEIVTIATGEIPGGPAPQRPYHGEIKAIFDAVDTLKAHSLDRIHAINYASLIQRAILPNHLLQASFGNNHFVLWRPRDIVGGDFYLYHQDADSDLIGIIDCAGHGVPGALMTMLARSAISQAVASVQGHDPAAILQKTDAIMRNLFDPEHYKQALATSMDAALVRIERRAGRLVFSGAKMSLYASNGTEVHEYKGGRRSISDKRRGDYANTHAPLEPGWTYYLCSDGFLDQAGGEQGFGFGNTRFTDMLRRHAVEPLEEQARKMADQLAEYQGNRPQRDDITLLAFRIA